MCYAEMLRLHSKHGILHHDRCFAEGLEDNRVDVQVDSPMLLQSVEVESGATTGLPSERTLTFPSEGYLLCGRTGCGC